ncbi:hypothetical protein M0802_003371 [Mischocyttarus mexicanus]|nr:hypothetical protein M0802_003371 [Mischocyttarus mexicanus]
MKISKSLLFCLIVCCGFYGLSDGASITSIIQDAVEEVGSNATSYLSIITGFLGCKSTGLNNIPLSSEYTTNPLTAIKQSLCYVIDSVKDLSNFADEVVKNPLKAFIQNFLPPIVQVLRSLDQSNIIPQPLEAIIHTIVTLYDINRLLIGNM